MPDSELLDRATALDRVLFSSDRDLVIEARRRQSDGFAGGYWLDPADGEGFGFVLFETAEQARRAMPPASDWSAPGVTILSVDVRRVAVGFTPRS